MPLVRLQNGTYINTDQLNWSPSAGGGTMYDATRLTQRSPATPSPFLPYPTPPALPGLTTRSVQTVGVDANGNPILPQTAQASPPVFQPGMLGRISPPSVPGPSKFAQMNQRDQIENKPAPQVAQTPSTIDTTNALDMSYYGLSAPSAPTTQQQTSDNSALEAIDQLTGSGRSTAVPFPLMGFNSPVYRPPVEVTVNGGNKPGSAFGGGWGSTGFALPSMNKPPAVPMPRNRPSPPRPEAYTIQSGDTLGALAKRFGTTVNQLANANGISNPNKIRAGATLNLGFMAPPVPRTPNAAQRWTSKYSDQPTNQQARAERFTNLDAFGMIK